MLGSAATARSTCSANPEPGCPAGRRSSPYLPLADWLRLVEGAVVRRGRLTTDWGTRRDGIGTRTVIALATGAAALAALVAARVLTGAGRPADPDAGQRTSGLDSSAHLA